MNDLIPMMVAPLILVHLFYIVAVIKKNLSVIDTAWGLGFILIALVGTYLSKGQNHQENLVSILVILWGLRLALFIHSRNRGQAEDFRYANWRKQWGDKANFMAYFKVYLLQFGLMLVVGLPLFSAHYSGQNPLSVVNYLGVLIWTIGFGWEAVADFQKSRFKSDQKNKDKVFQEGLWAFSRHPNYFGEALLWWGIALTSFSKHHYLGFIGSAFITFLLVKVSGVPLVEKRHENNPDYQAYAQHTPVLIPSLSKILKSLRLFLTC